ncbi:MAG: hypothetical protein VX519_04345 [Myxococcota bacterium]|nr:hypothetical protein [Myxococcota bacterium]
MKGLVFGMWIWGCTGGGISDPAEAVMELLDTDGSGDLSVAEIASPEPDRLHAELDANGNGVVSVDELRADLERWDRGVPKSP